MPNYIYNVSNLQLKQNTYSATSINTLNLRNVAWQQNSMANAFLDCTDLTILENINSDVTNMTSSFKNCYNLVTIPSIPNSVTSLFQTFYECRSLQNAPVIPDSVTNMVSTFYNCSSLVNIQNVPNSVSNLYSTFAGCNSLADAPYIPNSVTNMHQTFANCTNLVSVPHLSKHTIDLSSTFINCTALVNSPTIPNSVTNMYSTFADATSLTGDIYIYTNQIDNSTNCFSNTSLIKNVYIPYYNLYTNKQESITKSTFEVAGYDDQGTLENVYLKNLTPTIAINATPNDAIVTYEVDNQTITGDTIAVLLNSTVNWTVSKTGYITQQSTAIVDTEKTLNITLEEIPIIITIVPTPATAFVILEAQGYPTISGTGAQSITVKPNTEIAYSITAPGYNSQTDTITSPTNLTVAIELELESQDYDFTIDENEEATLVGYLGASTNVIVPDYVVGIPLNNNEADAGEITEVVENINDAGLVSDPDITDTNDAGTLDEQ